MHARADSQQKLSGELIVLSEGEKCGHSSWPIPSLKRLGEKLMSLLQPHSSPDKTADYTTCSGRRIVHVFACTLCLCVCHLTRSRHLLIACSRVRKGHFLNILSHTNRHSRGASYPFPTCWLGYIHQLSNTHDHISLINTRIHT